MAQDDIQGQVVDAQGNPVSGAIVELTKSYQSSPLDEQVVRRTTTDANGNYIFDYHPNGDGTTQEWHVSCYNHDGTAYVNSFNNPGVTADLPSNAIPDSVVDRFERANLNAPTDDNWGAYTGNTGGATIQSNTVLQGDSTLKLAAGNTITTQRDSKYTPTEINFLIQATASGNDFDGSRIRLLNSGTEVMFFDLEGDNTAEAGAGANNLGSWSDNIPYRVRLFNIDYNNNNYDAELIEASNGTVVGSASNIPFENSVSEINQIRILRNNSTTGTSNPMFIDDINTEPIA